MAIPVFSYGQTSSLTKKEQRKLLKEEKKRLAAEEAERNYELTNTMFENRKFVLESDMITDRKGVTNTADPSINFILADSVYGVIQLGAEEGLGLNGLGGITVEGRIENYQVEKNEKKRLVSVEFDITTLASGSYRVRIFAQSGLRGSATFSGSMGSGQMRYSGKLVPLEKSTVFKGTTTY